MALVQITRRATGKPIRVRGHDIRRIYAGVALALFLLLAWLTTQEYHGRYPVSLFLEINPYVAITTALTSRTVYGGLLLSLAIIIPTVFFGRFFCSWICPLGITNQIVSQLPPVLRKKDVIANNRYREIYYLKYVILLVSLGLAVFGVMQVGLLDPITIMMRSVSFSVFPALNWAGAPMFMKQPYFYAGWFVGFLFLAIILANRIITRFWCRALCPLGALLGLFAKMSLFRIRRDPDKCIDCDKCLTACQGAADPHSLLRVAECHVCLNCISDCPTNAISYAFLPEPLTQRPSPDLTRRQIIGAAAAGIAAAPMVRTSFGAEKNRSALVIRPPGSLDEPAFLSKCIKCAECMKVCPTNVLQPALLEAGIEGLWTPILDMRAGYCEQSCTACGDVCPTGAIEKFSLADRLGTGELGKPLKLGTAFYDQGRCLPWAMNTPCIVCEEVCPTSPKAIWVQDTVLTGRDGAEISLQRPFVDPSKCIGCGACEHACPVHDLRAVRVTSVGETRSKVNQILLKDT